MTRLGQPAPCVVYGLRQAACSAANAFENPGGVVESKRIAGLLKFFDYGKYLDDLLAGTVFFNTPEHYRWSGKEGQGDPHESCAFSFRKDRGDAPVQLRFPDNSMPEVLALTMLNGGRKPGWLHCWTAIMVPAYHADLLQLKADLNRIRTVFGTRYVFLPEGRITEFAKRIEQAVPTTSEDVLDFGLVEYSASKDDRGVWCKPTEYAYQREFRFVLGECRHDERNPRRVTHGGGFTDMLAADPTIRIVAEDDPAQVLHLDAEGCDVVSHSAGHE